MSWNKVCIIGNLGKDPDLRYTPQGQAVCSFSVATSEKRKDSQGNVNEHTVWFKVTAWGKTAEACDKYLAKGRPVYVEGRLRMEEWTDRDGKTRISPEVNANEVQFLSSGDRQDSPPRDRAEKADDGAMPLDDKKKPDDEIPF